MTTIAVVVKKILDAKNLASLMYCFRDALQEHKESLNSLNVYPVPDGDTCLLYTSPSPRDRQKSRMQSSA